MFNKLCRGDFFNFSECQFASRRGSIVGYTTNEAWQSDTDKIKKRLKYKD